MIERGQVVSAGSMAALREQIENRYELRWQGADEPQMVGVVPFFPEFEQLTGMKIQYEGYATAQNRQKIGIELVAKEPKLDAFGMQVSQEGRKYFENGWIEPLDKYIADKELTNPDWDLEDFGQGARSAQLIPERRRDVGDNR